MTQGKGKAFFDRADQVASTGNWDFAIEMYLEGILREPENIERGHKPLREVSLKRKAQGGKGPGIMEGMKHRPVKDPAQSLRNAEYLLAKEPGSVAFMEQVLNAAIKLELKDVQKWICDIMMEAQRLAKKDGKRLDKRILIVLTKAYEGMQEYASAVAACRMAVEAAPNDNALKDALRGLEANATIRQGGYDEGNLDQGIKDKQKQKDLVEQDRMVQSRSWLEEQIKKAIKEYEAAPTVPGKINGAADALLKIEEEAYENQAIDILAKGYKDTGAYQFKMRIGDIRMKQGKRRYAALVAAGDTAGAAQQAQKQLEFETAEYAERAANYPTDLAFKYELARRLYIAGKIDEAIPLLQQAQRDPRRTVTSNILLGQSFTRKGWFREAKETYERTLGVEMSEARKKEVLYNLGDVCERMGEASSSKDDLTKAQDYFSQVAQMDFNFKDVRNRIEALRKRLSQPA
ncbi:MAG: tetratricopeptide repeat protein [Phycisphaerae bacterium]